MDSTLGTPLGTHPVFFWLLEQTKTPRAKFPGPLRRPKQSKRQRGPEAAKSRMKSIRTKLVWNMDFRLQIPIELGPEIPWALGPHSMGLGPSINEPWAPSPYAAHPMYNRV